MSDNVVAEISAEATLNPRPKATEVETHGIDTIPDADRTSTWLDLLRIQFGGANTFATVLLGTFPIALGLSFWQAVLATVTGVIVGTVFLAPMGLFGPKTGTNNAVSSGALFGVRGRVVGSFLSLLTAIAFYSISVWVSGDALVGALKRLAGVPDTVGLRTLVYAIIGLVVIVVVIYGYQFMLLVNKTAVIANTILILLAIIAFAGVFDPSFDPGPKAYALGGFWATFVGAALIVMGNPISFGAFLGDWSRYIPKNTPQKKILLATVFGQLLTLIPFLFGVATATLVVGKGDYVVALIQASPIWYALLLMVVAVPPLLPRAGDDRDRRARLPLHSHRPYLLRPAGCRQRVHRRDHRDDDAVDGDHGDRLHRAPRPLRPAQPAGLQQGGDGRHLLGHRGQQLEGPRGLDHGGGHRTAVRELPAGHRRTVHQRGRRHRPQPRRGGRLGRGTLPRSPLPLPGAALRLRARWPARGAVEAGCAGTNRRERGVGGREVRGTACGQGRLVSAAETGVME
jgi:hypothetical protein